MKAKKLFFKECHLAGRQYHDVDEVWEELHVGTCLELQRDLDGSVNSSVSGGLFLNLLSLIREWQTKLPFSDEEPFC